MPAVLTADGWVVQEIQRDPATRLEPVTLDTDYVNTKALYVGGTGDVSVTMPDGNVRLLPNVQGGSVIPVAFKRVNTVDTTATDLVGMFRD